MAKQAAPIAVAHPILCASQWNTFWLKNLEWSTSRLSSIGHWAIFCGDVEDQRGNSWWWNERGAVVAHNQWWPHPTCGPWLQLLSIFAVGDQYEEAFQGWRLVSKYDHNWAQSERWVSDEYSSPCNKASWPLNYYGPLSGTINPNPRVNVNTGPVSECFS